jgi:hypothetical protein
MVDPPDLVITLREAVGSPIQICFLEVPEVDFGNLEGLGNFSHVLEVVPASQTVDVH